VNTSALDEIAALLEAGRAFRDGWLPLRGNVRSGFEVPARSLEVAELFTESTDHALHNALLNQIQLLLSDSTVKILSASSLDYPSRLRNVDGRPALLFVKGNLSEPAKSPLAIVGSRRASVEGLRVARQIAAVVAEAGHTIVSGLAAGVDSAGHLGALDAGGVTVAVMGTGLGVVFPIQNQGLAKRISQRGAIVSQFPPMQPPSKTTFPARNALIAALSDVSLLIESEENSGTRIEANCALAQGKRVLLWAPTLGDQAWARDFSTDAQVTFVSTVTEILTELSGEP
jgi:DNA processing protein